MYVLGWSHLLCMQEHVDEASPKVDMNDQAAGELLLNFANSAAMSSATQAGITELGLLTANKLCSSDQDTPQTKDHSVPTSKAPAQLRSEDTPVDRSRQLSETQAPVASQVTGIHAPESQTCRFGEQLGGASQSAVSGMQSAKTQRGAGGSEAEEGRVREMAADMLVGSLVSTIAQQSPATELPGDNAMMTRLVSFARACIGNSAPTESELRAALNRCKQGARASLLPNQALTAVRSMYQACLSVHCSEIDTYLQFFWKAGLHTLHACAGSCSASGAKSCAWCCEEAWGSASPG